MSGTLGIITEQNVPVPMRDGVVLRANIFRPDSPAPCPALLMRTPYGKAARGQERFVHAGYALVSQDMRGRYDSDGTFRVLSEPETADGEDGYDSVEWLAEQPWCDGNVGTVGTSYLAWTQWQLARLRPPHLRAMSALSIPVELTDLDWTGGIFRPGRRINWWLNTIGPDLRRRAGMSPPHTPQHAAEIWQEIERQRMLDVVPWIEIVRYLPPPLAAQAETFLRNPLRRPWRFADAHKEIEVPNLDFTGWYDHCCSIGHFTGMRRNGRSDVAREQTRVVVGPWFHGGLGQRKCGEVDFGPQAQVDVVQMQIRWFDRWLKGIENGQESEPPLRYFVVGSCQWKSSDNWPPPGATPRDYFLGSAGHADRHDGDGALREEPPVRTGPDEYVYDPRNPCPTLWTANQFYTASDRRRLHYRDDILYYRTPPLENEREIAGNPEVILHVSSSALDTDFFAWLVDEAPDGPATSLCYGAVRVRHRNGVDREDFLNPDEIVELRIQLGPTACRFERGHRIRLEVGSSDFPNFDRNHNVGRNDIVDAEMVPARQRLHHSAAHPSRLILPTMTL